MQQSHHGMSRTITLALAGVAVALALGFAAVSSKPPQAVIAVVNLEAVFDGLNERRTLESTLQSELEPVAARIARLQDERQALEEQRLVAREEDKRGISVEILRIDGHLQFEQELVQRTIDFRKGQMMQEIYLRINGAVQRLARQNGYSLVLASDAGVEVQAGRQIDVMRQISLRRMLYVENAHDVTNELILMMNNEHAAGAVPGGQNR